MSSPAGFLEFFVLEASDYIEQIDALVSRAGSLGPDASSLQRAARALRGSATMAKLPAFAELAGAVERVGRALRDNALRWEPSVSSALIAAVDDLKVLVRAARDWTPAQTQRATTRAAELARLAPEHAARPSTPATITGGSYFASEAANVAAGLELLATRPSDRDAAANVLRRIRALRGVAGVRELPPLGEVLEGGEQAARPLELGERTLGGEAIELLRATATLLHRIAAALRQGAPVPRDLPERARFDRAVEALLESEHARERIVPIAELFTPGEPGVVNAATNPPTTPPQRFRLEMVSQAEHLRGLVDDARLAPDDTARERLRRELRRSLRSLSAAAESFGERDVAAQIAARESALRTLDDAALEDLEVVAKALAQPGTGGGALAARLTTRPTPSFPSPVLPADAVPPRVPTPPIAAAAAPLARPPAAAPPASARAQAPAAPTETPTEPIAATPSPRTSVSGEHLTTALEGSLASLSTLERRTFSPPLPLPEEPAVPIQSVVYKGRAALERALELREEVRRSGGTPSPAVLDELFDLLDLARDD